MRFVFLLLVFVNLLTLGYFLFSTQGQAQASVVSRAPELNSPSFQLVRESRQQAISDGAAGASSVNQCELLGPYSTSYKAGEAITEFKDRQIDSALMSEIVQKPSSYRVLISSKTTEAAQALFSELQEKTIDSYIIRSGELKNSISLGAYTRVSSAEIRAKEILEQGYKSDIAPIYKDVKQYWLAFTPESASKIKQKEREIIASGRQLFKSAENSCQDLALLEEVQ